MMLRPGHSNVRQTVAAYKLIRPNEPMYLPDCRYTHLLLSVTENTNRKPSPVLMYCSLIAENSS